MKALSFKQPWAWLVCAGHKEVDNRSWHIHMPPLLNYPDTPRRIYVHAGLSRAGLKKEVLAWILERLDGRKAAELMLVYNRLPFGAIIGEVDITGCVKKSDSPWFVGPYGFTLANPVLYDKPVSCKGSLAFFVPDIREGNDK